MPLPEGFCNLESRVVGLKVCSAYYFSENFTGKNVTGYLRNTAVGTLEMADGLERALKIVPPRARGQLLRRLGQPPRGRPHQSPPLP